MMKMKYIYRRWLFLMAGALLVANFASCNDNDENSPILPPAYSVDRSNMFGIHEQPKVGENIGGQSDNGVTPQLVADMCGALGVKSFRMLLHLSWVFDHDAEGNLIFKEDNLQNFKDYAALLTEKGVRNIMLTNAAYMYPYGYTRSHWKAVPEPGTELYIKFMQQIEDSYKMLAAAFPDVTQFEVGNELNAPKGHNLCKDGFRDGATAEENAPFIFTTSEQALVTADICYYANRGVKAANPKAKFVAPGLYMVDIPETKAYLSAIYDHVVSGKLPSTSMEGGKRKLAVDTDPSHYFEYLNWHPYIHEGHTLSWLAMNESLYQIAVDHGDAGRKIIISEFGYFDSYLERREELIADVCVPAIVALTERLQTIESVYMFRMFNWTSAGSAVVETEQTYGIFDSPMQPLGVRPKPVALSLFFHFNGVESDPDPLYKYMK